MPTDSRRLQGPEDAFSYRFLRNDNEGKATADDVKMPLVVDGVRRDKRKPSDARPLFLKTGVITQAKGSAYVEQGNTKVICGVHGPREVQKKSDFSLNGQLYCEFKFAPFSCIKKRGHQPDSEELELSGLLKEALEAAVCLHQFPKAQVEVYVMVMENDGSAFAAALTCASLALANASIPMYDIVIGASVRNLNGASLLDPAQEEEWSPQAGQDKQNCNLTIGFMPSLHQICGFLQEGFSDVNELNGLLKLATEYCLKVEPIAQLCLKEAVQKVLSEKLENHHLE